MEPPENLGGNAGASSDQEDLQKVFVQNVKQTILTDFLSREAIPGALYNHLGVVVAVATHKRWHSDTNLAAYVEDFEQCLAALTSCYRVLVLPQYGLSAHKFDQLLLDLMQECCKGLALRWEKGKFVRH
jgi:hypothetical protein